MSSTSFTIEEIPETLHKYDPSVSYVKIRPTICPDTPLGHNLKLNSCFLTKKFALNAKLIHEFEVFEDDVWVISFPKCGTTWTQEMVWMIGNNLDFQKGKSAMLVERFPFIELSSIARTEFPFSTIEQAKNAKRPRFIKSHLPVALLPKQLWMVKPKIIYVTRNPKDAVISYFHHSRTLEQFSCNIEEFYQQFINGTIIYGPFHSHILEFWQMRMESYISFHTYEEMSDDLPTVIQRISKFLLGKSLSDIDVKRLCEHLSIDAMRKNDAVNMQKQLDEYYEHANIIDPEQRQFKFLRNGKSGEFKTVMSTEWIEKFNKWIANELNGSDFKFDV